MAKSTGKAGIGVTLKLSDGDSPPQFVTVGNVVSLEAGGRTLNTIDATHLASPDFYQEFIPGLKSSQAWTGTVQWDASDPTLDDSTGLAQRLEDRELTTLRIDFTDIGVNVAFEADGFITELGNLSIAAESIMTQSFGFQPSGRVRIITLTP